MMQCNSVQCNIYEVQPQKIFGRNGKNVSLKKKQWGWKLFQFVFKLQRYPEIVQWLIIRQTLLRRDLLTPKDMRKLTIEKLSSIAVDTIDFNLPKNLVRELFNCRKFKKFWLVLNFWKDNMDQTEHFDRNFEKKFSQTTILKLWIRSLKILESVKLHIGDSLGKHLCVDTYAWWPFCTPKKCQEKSAKIGSHIYA